MIKNPPIGLQTKICLLHSKSDLQSPTRQMNRWSGVGEGEIQRCSPSTATHPAVIPRRKKKNILVTRCASHSSVGFNVPFYFRPSVPASPAGWTGEKVCLAGDSAGGNLCVTASMRAAAFGVRMPDGIVAAYPATLLTAYASPSRLLTLMDPLLPLSVLSRCLSAYAGPCLSVCDYMCACIQTSGLQKYFYTLCTFPHLNV